MSPAKKGKARKKKEAAKGEAKPEVVRPVREESDEATDYGGLPVRDLKKNLGCG